MDCIACQFPHLLLSPRVCSNSCPLSQWCYLTISSSATLLSFNLSQHHCLFQWVGSLHQAVQVLELKFSPSKEYSGLISFRTDWFDRLAVQGTLKSLLQHHGSKSSILGTQPSFAYQTTTQHLNKISFWRICESAVSSGLGCNSGSRLQVSGSVHVSSSSAWNSALQVGTWLEPNQNSWSFN